MIGIEFNSANQMTLGTGPRKVAAEYRLAQRSMTFGKMWIELDCGLSSFVRRGGTFRKRHHAEDAQPIVIVCHSGIGQCVLRIDRDCLLVTNNRSCKTVFSKPVPVETAAQVGFVCFRIVGAAFG